MAGTNVNTMEITAPAPAPGAGRPTGPPPGFPTAEFQREARLASAVMFARDIVNAHAPTQPATGRQDLGGEQPADPRTPAPMRAAPGNAQVESGEIEPEPSYEGPTIITPDSQARLEPSRRVSHAAAGFHRFLSHHVTAYPNLAILMGPQNCVAWLDSFLSAITPLVDEYLAIANPSLGDAQTLLDADTALTNRRNSLLTTMAALPAPPVAQQQAQPRAAQDQMEVESSGPTRRAPAAPVRKATTDADNWVPSRPMSTVSDKPYVLYGCHAAPNDLPQYMKVIPRHRFMSVSGLIRKVNREDPRQLDLIEDIDRHDHFMRWFLEHVDCPVSFIPDADEIASRLQSGR